MHLCSFRALNLAQGSDAARLLMAKCAEAGIATGAEFKKALLRLAMPHDARARAGHPERPRVTQHRRPNFCSQMLT